MNFKKEILEPLVEGFKLIGSVVLLTFLAVVIFSGIVAFTELIYSLSTLLGAILTIFWLLCLFTIIGRELRV